MKQHGSPLYTALVSSALLTAALLLLPAVAPSAAAQDVGQVVHALGQVTGTPAGGSARALAVGDGFALGYQVATGAGSESLLTFDPRGSLRLGEETRVSIDRSLIDSAGRAESGLSVLLGRLRVAVGRLFSGDLTIDTPTATVGIKGTDVEVIVAPNGTTRVRVYEGEVTVTGKAGGEVTLRGGERTVVRPGAGPLVPMLLDPYAGPREDVGRPAGTSSGGDTLTDDLYGDFPENTESGGDNFGPFPPRAPFPPVDVPQQGNPDGPSTGAAGGNG